MLKTYDPKLVVLTVGGVPISGYADGTAITVERSNDMYTKTSGNDGIVSRAKSNDKSGTVTVTLAQTSSSNDVLSGFHKQDELSNTGVKVINCKDVSGRSTFFSGLAWIRKYPNSEFAKEISNREWVIDCDNLDIFVGGHAPAVPA